MNEPKLKPCPFCGGKAKVTNWELHTTHYYVCCATLGCREAGLVYSYDSREDAIEKWNRRPLEDKLQQKIEKLTIKQKEQKSETL